MPVTATRPRLGFVGLGWIGRARLDALEAEGVAEIAAVADPAVTDALDTIDELYHTDLDGVVIATPSALHAQQAISALEQGLAVFCQKPLGRTAAETLSVVEAARRAGCLLAVDLGYRQIEAFRMAREVVRSGELGEIVAGDLVFHNAHGPDKPWFYDPDLSGGGCVIDLGVHLVDLALWTLGVEPEAVTSRLVGEPVEQFATAELDQLRLVCSWNLHAGRDAVVEVTFYGSDGAVSVRNVDGSFYDFRCERMRGTSTEVLVEPPDEWGGRAVVEWAQRLAAGEGFDARAEEYVKVANILDRIYGR